MKIKELVYIVVAVILIICTATITRKLFPKVKEVEVVKYIEKYDTVPIITYVASPPKYDTFYTQEVLYGDIIPADTAKILEDYFKVYDYNDTIVNNKFALVSVKEKVSTNKLIYREIKYQNKIKEIEVPDKPTLKEMSKWYAVGGIGTSIDKSHDTYLKIGIGYKFKKDQFVSVTASYIINKPYVEVSLAIPIK
jgi:hypothetical protein